MTYMFTKLQTLENKDSLLKINANADKPDQAIQVYFVYFAYKLYWISWSRLSSIPKYCQIAWSNRSSFNIDGKS